MYNINIIAALITEDPDIFESQGFNINDNMDLFAREATEALLMAKQGDFDKREPTRTIKEVYRGQIESEGQTKILSVVIYDENNSKPGNLSYAGAIDTDDYLNRINAFTLRYYAKQLGLSKSDDPRVLKRALEKHTAGFGDHIAIVGSPPWPKSHHDKLFQLILHEIVHFFDPSIKQASEKTRHAWDTRSLEAEMSGNPAVYSDLPHELTADLSSAAHLIITKFKEQNLSQNEMREIIRGPQMLNYLPTSVLDRYPDQRGPAIKKLRTIVYNRIT